MLSASKTLKMFKSEMLIMLILSRSGKNCFVGRLFTCSASSAVVIAVLLLFCHTLIIVYGRDTLGHFVIFL
jgi:hypothetical protein